MSTFDSLVDDLTRDAQRVQPKDALQFCANWFQSRLEEQRARTRDILSQRNQTVPRDLPTEFYIDTPLGANSATSTVSPFSQTVPQHRPSIRNSTSHNSPFGTLNIPGNALLSEESDMMGPPTFTVDGRELPPTSPLTTSNPFSTFEVPAGPTSLNPGDCLHPPTATIFARRTSVSAESIAVDSTTDEQLPVYPKTEDQLRRIKASIANNFIFRDLDEEQETGVLSAMQEQIVEKGEVVIRQGDVGEYFYVVESGLLHCYIRPEPLPPTWFTTDNPAAAATTAAGGGAVASSEAPAPPPHEKFLQPGYHSEFGRKVAECKPGNSFGELALMYGHPRAATVLAIEQSTLWSLDRITFRTIILKAAHRRRTMYEHFLSTVTLLSSLEPEERSKIADALVSKVYMDGEAVVRQGEMGDTFFFVEEGEAIATKTQAGDDGEMKEIKVGHLKKGDYFGGECGAVELFLIYIKLMMI
jgi:cAMP-dependent protein kinase regulator